jgi:hypothetical protein
MAIDGRINVDVLFHDTDGTTSLKVVSLEDSTAYTTGKVAIVTGTCGTTEVSVSISPGTYRDASGAIVNFTSVSRFAFAATPGGRALQEGEDGSGSAVVSRDGQLAIASPLQSSSDDFFVYSIAGTASYMLVIYGT